MSDMEVRLVPHTATELRDTPEGEKEVTVEFNQFQVWIHGEDLINHNPDMRLLVGYIEKTYNRRGRPKFCAIANYELFTHARKQWIHEEVMRLHPCASPAKPNYIPPHEATLPDVQEEQT